MAVRPEDMRQPQPQVLQPQVPQPQMPQPQVQTTRSGGSPAPSPQTGSPSHLSRTQWKDSLKAAMKHAKADRVNIVGGSLAYRWFLSLFPILILLLAVTALLHLSQSTVTKLVRGAEIALPSGASTVVSQAITHAQGRTSGAAAFSVVAGLAALFSATSAMSVLQVGLDMAYEIRRDRPFLKKRLVALLLMIGVAVLGGAASALTVFGPAIGHAIAGQIGLAGSAFVALWTVIRWVAAILLVMMLFAFIYWLGPNRETPKWQWITPGSLFGAGAWLAASLAFSYYTSSFGSYGKTYGAFAGIAILIFWLYITGIVVLVGAEINAELERHKTSAA